MYWDIDKTLSHNCLFNYAIGPRGCGKTYGAKKKAVKRFLKSGDEFIYLRRYKTELADINTFWADIIRNDEYPDNKLESKNGRFYIDDKIAGYALPLSVSKIKKSVAFPNVSLIIFDEFIIERGVYHYLADEVKTFLEFYLTVSRYRPVIVLFIANAITMSNPYFIHFDLYLPHGSNIFKRGDCLLELIENKEFSEHVKQTRVGKLLQEVDHDYSAYAMDNRFLLDSKNFVMKRTEYAKHHFNIVYNAKTYGVWVDWADGLMFLSESYDPLSGFTYALTTSDHKPNTLLIRSLRQSNSFSMLIENYKLGNVRFESVRVKNIAMEFMKLVMRS